MSSLKQLEKAAKVIAEIKELDKRIIELEKLAELVANGSTEHSFELKIKAPKADGEKVEFDEDGSLVTNHFGGIAYALSGFTLTFGSDEKKPKEDKNTTTFKDTPSDVTTLHILGFLLSGLVTKREALINKIQKLGFEL